MNAFTYTNRFSARLFAILAVISLIMSLMPMQAFATHNPEHTTGGGPAPKIDICHATGAHANPYTSANADQTADAGGHDGHNPNNAVWFPGIEGPWGDIIPPFDYDGGHYDGKNWTSAGQAILRNGCKIPKVEPTTGAIIVKKEFTRKPENVSATNFHFKLNDATAVEFEADGSNTLTNKAPGQYTITEVEANRVGYTTNYTGCSFTLAAGATTTCVITNVYPVDVCPNIDGVQAEVPLGKHKDQAGNCVPDENPQYADVTLCKVGGTGVPMSGWELFLKKGDDTWKNGTTASETGCLTISHVLYNTYKVEETMKSEFWDNVATTSFGVNTTKGAEVVIDSPTETFTLMNREVEHCDDEDALNNGKRGKCEYPEEGNEVITACKYLPVVGEEPREPVAGWGMLFVNAEDPDSEGAVALYGTTTENGCVSKEVDPEDGPWFVFEQNKAGWTQVNVGDIGGDVLGTSGNKFCKFFAPTILDRALSFFSSDTILVDESHRCDFYNEEDEVVVPACAIGSNLLQNGSFEAPVVTDHGGTWEIFSSVPSWVISLSDGLEIWRNFNGSGAGLASDGAQNIEMDGNDATKITQSVATVAGATYELKFDFSPRAGTGLADNNVDAAANGNLVVNVTGDGSANSGNVWTTHGGTFVAAGTSTGISFEDKGAANEGGGLGALIDNARLCKVKDPEPPAPACKVNVFSDVTNTVTQKGNLNAIVVTNQPVPPWVASITGSLAQWIWGNPASGSSIDPVNNETQTFVKTFVWNGPVTSGKLKLSADNFYTVTLNGTTVAATTTEFNYNVTKEFDIASLVQQGTNTLEIAVTNMANGATAFDSNPAGLLYDLTVVGNNTTDCTQTPGGGGDNDELSCTLTASDASVRRGNGVTLNWTTDNAVSANVTTLGDLASTSLPNGSGEIAEVNSDTTFVMTVMDDSEKEATCSVTVNTTGGGGGGGGRRNNDDNDGDVAGDSSSRPKGQVLGEQVSVVPLGAADAGAGGTAPVALPSFGFATAAFLARTRK